MQRTGHLLLLLPPLFACRSLNLSLLNLWLRLHRADTRLHHYRRLGLSLVLCEKPRVLLGQVRARTRLQPDGSLGLLLLPLDVGALLPLGRMSRGLLILVARCGALLDLRLCIAGTDMRLHFCRSGRLLLRFNLLLNGFNLRLHLGTLLRLRFVGGRLFRKLLLLGARFGRLLRNQLCVARLPGFLLGHLFLSFLDLRLHFRTLLRPGLLSGLVLRCLGLLFLGSLLRLHLCLLLRPGSLGCFLLRSHLGVTRLLLFL